MTDDKKRKPGVAFWTTVVVVVVLVLYVASFGPACWLADNGIILPMRATAIAYRPLMRAASFLPRPIQGCLRRYAEWHAGPLVPTWMGPRQDPIEAGIIERLRAAW